MNRVESILKKAIGQGIGVAFGYVVYLITENVFVALIVTAVMSRVMEDIGL